MNFEHKSIWHATANPAKTFPSLSSSVSADVAIVGGGISGLTCAYLLAKAGKRVVVLEGRKIGLGTTGHSTGNLYGLVDFHISKLIGTWGKEVATQVVASRLAAIDFIEKTVHDLNIDCQFQRVGFHYFSENLGDKEKQFFGAEIAAAREVGLLLDKTTKSGLPFSAQAVLEIRNQAQFHPLNYAYGICQALPNHVTLYENSPVIDFDLKSGWLYCPSGKVSANHIVFATHVPKGVNTVQMRLQPIREHGIAAELKGNAFPGIFWRVDQPKRSVRTVTVSGKTYVMVIGSSFKTGHKEDTREENRILDKYLTEHYETVGKRFWWGAQSYRGGDMLPFIGNQSDNAYYLTGFSADGLIYGTLGAQIISDKILGKKNKFEELYKTKRMTPMKSAKTYAKEGIDTFSHYLRDLPKVGTSSVNEIPPGDGRIIEQQGEKLAVFRSETGEIKACSAVCTHMKCILTFNTAEKTWDCPCHASRFDLDGKVIEGPALSPLERKTL